MDISSMLEVQVNEYKESDSKENLTPLDVAAPVIPSYEDISQDEEQFFQLMFNGDIASIRFRKLHCTACDVHIGSAPSSATNMFEHPILRTLLCARCHEFYGDGTFEQGEDQTDMFCRWCANGGNLYCCATCSNTFCSKCIKRNFDPSIRKKIEADEKWRCFVCDPTDLFPLRSMCRAIIQHVQTVTRILQVDKTMTAKQIEEKMILDESPCCPRKRKRKRKRTGSNSEEEDESYQPFEIDTSSLPSKRRRTRRSLNSGYTNGDADDDDDDGTMTSKSMDSNIELDENSSPALHCEQSMIESENEIVAPDGKIIRNPQAMPPRMPMLSPAFKKVVSINPIPTANLMKPVFQPRKFKTFPKVNNVLEMRQMMQRGPRAAHPSPPMVSIPAQPAMLQKKTRPRVLLPKPRILSSPSNQSTSSPSVINLESDDEDLVVLEGNQDKSNQAEKTKENTANNEPKIVTRAETRPVQVSREKHSPERNLAPCPSVSASSFKQFLVQKNREIDTVLNTMKHQLKKTVNDPGINYDDPSQVARRVTGIHKAIYKSIYKFAEQSDAIAMAFDRWRQQKLRRRSAKSSRTAKDNNGEDGDKEEEETVATMSADDILLEMLCFNESEEEAEESDDGTVHLPVLPKSCWSENRTSMLDDFVFFRKRNTRDIGTGETDLSVRDATVQANDVDKRNLEKCIGFSVLTKKVSSDAKSREQPNAPDAAHGKYVDQYLDFLQHVEDHGIETEDERGLKSDVPEPPIIPPTEVMDVDDGDESPVEESPEDESQMNDSQMDESQMDESREDESQVNDSQENESPMDERQPDESPMDESAPSPVKESPEMEPSPSSPVKADTQTPDDDEARKAKTLPDPNETPLKDLIEANSPFISEMLRSIGTPVLTNGSCPEPEPEPTAKSQLEDANSRAVEDLAEIVTKLSNDIEDSAKADEASRTVQELIEDDAAAKKQPSVGAGDDECALID